ncbi:prepilin-type N-terminal cleavage/methylation domain-containing protein [Candidatus Saccharibacteria bacterium]|nr:MAG: prepilin-type N-terminal cleavage/methylation domain-containing protein [Candidatus Saccharibacteria bacterium]
MVSLKSKKGFTIVELLIVIVVIGILATLVIVTFTGIQQKGRNSQRQTDVKAIQSQVEAFFAQHGFYPTLADLQSATFVSTYLKGLPPEALKDPKGPTANIGGTTDSDNYSYVAEGPTGGTVTCDNAVANPLTGGEPVDNGCDAFTVSATLEGSTTPFTQQSN